MAHCVINQQSVPAEAIPDQAEGVDLAALAEYACNVHCVYVPPGTTHCYREGQPASPVPIHGYLGPNADRREIVGLWRHLTAAQRPLVIHTDTHEHPVGPDCPHGCEVMPGGR